MNGFRTENELLAQRAQAFGGLADRADRIATDLQTGVAEYGVCWGRDPVGRAFADGHVEAADAALTGIGALPEDLSDLGSRLTATASTYAASEQSSHTTIRGTGRELL